MGKRMSLVRLVASVLLLASFFCIALAQQQGTTRSSEAEKWAIVKGAVRVPARLKLSRPVRLLEVLAISGGVKGNVKDGIFIVHADGTSDTYRLKDIKRGVKNKSNPYIQAGDIITVAE